MEVVLIFNGLGNQMSQYAFFLAKRKFNKKIRFIFDPNSKAEHNGSELDTIFGVKYSTSIINKVLEIIYSYRNRPKIWKILKTFGIHEIRETSNYGYNNDYLRKRKFGIYFYWGGWHSEKYFSNIKSEIKEQYVFPKQTEISFCNVLDNIITSQSCSIHIRRGDYLKYSEYGNVATLDYYRNAIKYISSCCPNVVFFVFSNDLDWCKKEFVSDNFVFVCCNTAKKSWRDMYLMSQCKYHINANSTFSWWASWLSPYQDEIVVPSKFLQHTVTKDIYPDSWIKL